MRLKFVAGSGFLLNTIFFATYYAVAKEALTRIDPIVFTFFEMITLAPAAVVIILCSWKHMTRAVIKRGVLLGSTLCLALFTIAIALKYTTATSTAFFPALNGFLAALIAWAFFRERASGQTWLAGVISLVGAALLIFSSSMGNLRGTLIAFLGGLFYTCYVFLCDREQKDEKAAWPLFGVELLTTAVWANLVVLLFGDWQAVHPILPKDIWVILYVSTACTFTPTLISVLFQKYLSPVTVSFIYILEPVLGAIIANLYLHEVLPIQGYIGGGLVIVGALVNSWVTVGQPTQKRVQVLPRFAWPVRGSWVMTILYPGLSCILGAALLYRLGGLPPTAWNDVSHLWPQFSQEMSQGQGTYITLLLVQAGGWLIAWISVLLMGCLALYHLLQRLFQQAALDAQTRGRGVPRSVVRPAPAPVQTGHGLEKPPVQVVRGTIRPVVRPAPRVRTTVPLAEQTTWYGEAVSPVAAGRNSSPGRDIPPSTDPLLRETLLPIQRRASRAQPRVVRMPSLESLDA